MRVKACLLGLVGSFLLAAPTQAIPDPFLIEGTWWFESPRADIACVLTFDIQALGTFEVQGYGVSTVAGHEDSWDVDFDDGMMSGTPFSQRVTFDERGRVVSEVGSPLIMTTSADTLAAPAGQSVPAGSGSALMTLANGKLNRDKEKLNMLVTLDMDGVGGTAPTAPIRLKGIRLPTPSGQPVSTGRSTDARLRNRRPRSFSNKMDIQVLREVRGFPSYELIIGGPATLADGASRKFALRGMFIQTPKGKVVGFANMKNPFDLTSEFFSDLPRNVIVSGKYNKGREIGSEQATNRPKLNVTLLTTDANAGPAAGTRFKVKATLLRVPNPDVPPPLPPPTIDPPLLPLRVAQGNVVTITGTNFDTGFIAPRVFFDAVQANNVIVLSPNSLTVEVPPGVVPSTVDVTVTNPDSPPFSRGASATEPNYFFYAPPPVIDTTGSPFGVLAGDRLRIDGTGFSDGAGLPEVLFGATPGTGVVVDPSGTYLEVDVPIGTVGSTINVTITNVPDLQSDTAIDYVTYILPPPVP